MFFCPCLLHNYGSGSPIMIVTLTHLIRLLLWAGVIWYHPCSLYMIITMGKRCMTIAVAHRLLTSLLLFIDPQLLIKFYISLVLCSFPPSLQGQVYLLSGIQRQLHDFSVILNI